MGLISKMRKHGINGSLRIAQEVLCKPIRPLIYFLFRFFPIDDKLIIFESQPDLWDNAWAMYQHFRERGGYRFVWMVEDTRLYTDTGDTKFVSRLGHGLRLKSYWFYSQAKYNIFTHWTLPEFVKRKGQVVIYTSHGIAIKAGKGGGGLSFDYTFSLGKFVNGAQCGFLNCEEEKVLSLGYPRNDLLIRNVSVGVDNPFSIKGVDKVVFWMPTFRKSFQNSLSETGCDTETGLPLYTEASELSELDAFLRGNRLLIIVKIHHLQATKYVFFKKFSNLLFLTDDDLKNNGFQLYEVLGKSDALISDYSSVSFDYLLVNKPIGYVLDDIVAYEQERGFVWDNVKDVMPGHHIYNEGQFKGFLLDVKNGKDVFEKERNLVKDRVFDYTDGNSCDRIVKFFGL